MLKLNWLCCLGLALALLAPVSQAQPGMVVSGLVVDPSDALVEGATVTLKSRSPRDQRTTRTDGSGLFRFEGLTTGKYDVQVEMSGFRKMTVRLNAADPRQPAVRLTLAIAEMHEDVTVESVNNTPDTDIDNNLNSTTLNERMLDRLPSMGGDVIGAATRLLLPRGSRATVIVDGVETRVADVRKSEIQSIRLNRNPYSAEYSRPGSSRFEITTRRGSPVFHGSFDFNFRDSTFDARNAFAASRPDEQHRTYNASLSGPLGNKKTTFSTNFWRDESDLQSIVYAVTPTGQFRQNVPTEQVSTLWSGRVGRQIGGKDQLSIRYSLFDWTNRNAGVEGFTLPEAGFDSHTLRHGITLNYTKVISPKLVNDVTLSVNRSDSRTDSRQPGVQIVVVDAFIGGGAQADFHETSTSGALNEIISWSHGRHAVRAGFSLPELGRTGYSDRRNFGGTFSFSSLADFQLGRPFSYSRDEGDGRFRYYSGTVAGFFQDNIQLRKNFSVGIGLRYEWQQYIQDHNNFAPRVSFAYAPGPRRKTVIRGGAGVFYDRAGWQTIADSLRFNGSGGLRNIVLSNPTYPNPTGTLGTSGPQSLVRLDRNLRSPYMADFSLSLEQQVSKAVVTVSYQGQRGIHQFRSDDINAPLPPLYSVRPDPLFGVIRDVVSDGRSQLDSLRVSVAGDISKYFNGSVSYNLSRRLNNTEGIYYFRADRFDTTGEWARAGSDQRHGISVAGAIEGGRWLSFGIGASFGSGLPYTLTTGRDINMDTRASDRPRGVGRNTQELPWNATVDLRWSRSFYILRSKQEKGPTFSISVDAFNIFNRTNIISVVSNLSSPLFGIPVAADVARRLQLSLGMKF